MNLITQRNEMSFLKFYSECTFGLFSKSDYVCKLQILFENKCTSFNPEKKNYLFQLKVYN